MPTECRVTLFEFARGEGRLVLDGGRITADASGLLLAATDRAVGLVDRFAACFSWAPHQTSRSAWPSS